MQDTPTLQALLNFEDSNSELLFEQAPGSQSYLWALARWPIATALTTTQSNNQPPAPSASKEPSKFYYLKRMIREALPNTYSADNLHEQVDHLFLVHGGTITSASNGIGNWLSDDFAMALADDAAVIQDLKFDSLTPRSQRPANPRTWTWAPALSRIREQAKTNSISKAAQQHVVEYMQRIYTQLDAHLPATLRSSITQEVLGWVRMLGPTEIEFNAVLDRAQPRRIYLQQASYSHFSSIVRIAHDRGVEVAEPQHGWIGAAHAAYNYGSAWFASPLTSSLPDTLLTFGDHWGKHLRFPGKIAAIGKPSLDRASTNIAPYGERSKRLLLVSSEYERDVFIASAKKLRALLPDIWEIALRPHPHERAEAETLFADALVEGISLDLELDVTLSVSRSRAIVGTVSTVLFEALPLGVHIGVIETALANHYASTEIFPQRLNNEESFRQFTELVISDATPDIQHAHSVWKPQAINSFLEKYAAR